MSCCLTSLRLYSSRIRLCTGARDYIYIYQCHLQHCSSCAGSANISNFSEILFLFIHDTSIYILLDNDFDSTSIYIYMCVMHTNNNRNIIQNVPSQQMNNGKPAHGSTNKQRVCEGWRQYLRVGRADNFLHTTQAAARPSVFRYLISLNLSYALLAATTTSAVHYTVYRKVIEALNILTIRAVNVGVYIYRSLIVLITAMKLYSPSRRVGG